MQQPSSKLPAAISHTAGSTADATGQKKIVHEHRTCKQYRSSTEAVQKQYNALAEQLVWVTSVGPTIMQKSATGRA
jgi:hypothetical protein